MSMRTSGGRPRADSRSTRLSRTPNSSSRKTRSVTIHLYSADIKPAAANTQGVTVKADANSGRTKLEFEKKDDSLVSKTKLPEGDGYNVVVQFKQTDDAKPRNFRFKLDMRRMQACGICLCL